MTTKSSKAFANEIDRIVQYFKDEFDLTFIEAIGVLTTKASFLAIEAHALPDDDE